MYFDRWSRLLYRNWIPYASLLTIAAIAVTRSVGILMSRFNLDSEERTFFTLSSASVGCVAIWAISFAMIAPSAFNVTIGPYYFNTAGYEIIDGKCKPIPRDPSDGLHNGIFLFNVGVLIPLFFILVSYIFISAVLEVENRRKQRILNTQTQVPVRQIQVTSVLLSAAILIFVLPLSIIANITFDDDDTERTAFEAAWGWCYWMYAANVILYVTTLRDFRMMFKQVFKEFICCFLVAASRNDNLNEMPSSQHTTSSTI